MANITSLYDGNRQLTKMTDSGGDTTYIYNDMNWLEEVTDNRHSVISLVKYSYDLKGNRTSITYPDSKIISYTFDANDRLESVTDWNSRQTTYSYSKLNNPIGVTYPNTIQGFYTWDDSSRLTAFQYAKGVTPFIDRSFVLDEVGNRSSETVSAGLEPVIQPKVQRLVQNDADRLTSVSEKPTPDDSWSTANYSYDNNGNLLSGGGLTLEYDFENRLTSASGVNPQPSVFLYDGLGDRTKRVENGTTYLGSQGQTLKVESKEGSQGQTLKVESKG